MHITGGTYNMKLRSGAGSHCGENNCRTEQSPVSTSSHITACVLHDAILYSWGGGGLHNQLAEPCELCEDLSNLFWHKDAAEGRRALSEVDQED